MFMALMPWLTKPSWFGKDVLKKTDVLEMQFHREYRTLVLPSQTFTARYDIWNWLISGMCGHETVCAEKHCQQTVRNH
jgi:hypothetical protein